MTLCVSQQKLYGNANVKSNVASCLQILLIQPICVSLWDLLLTTSTGWLDVLFANIFVTFLFGVWKYENM